MDQIKIGKFIASMRKEQGLSQKQLAERIDVTDKTISKWETGNRLPDASILLRLSQELHALPLLSPGYSAQACRWEASLIFSICLHCVTFPD